jgi:glyoxylate reductase
MTILASRRFPGEAFDELKDVEILPGKLRDVLSEPRPDVRTLATVHDVVDDDVLALLPNLDLVANYGVGYDGVDVLACEARGVLVSNTPGVVDASTADLALALMLASRRRVVEADTLVRNGEWRTTEDDALLAPGVAGAVLGIVGCGRIGRATARRARAFDMDLAYSQRHPLPESMERELALTYRELDELLEISDVVTLHCPLTPETEQLIDRAGLARMKDGACLVNTARGRIVDQDALVDELDSGRISAALDVFAEEPHVPERLLRLPNVVLSPHHGTATSASRVAMTRLLVDNIQAVAGGRPPVTPVRSSGA